MDYLIHHLLSGQAFFSGAGVVAVCALAWLALRGRVAKSIVMGLAILGMAFALLSGTPLAAWFYRVALAVTIAWVFSSFSNGKWARAGAGVLPWLVAVIWLVGIALEAPFHRTTRIRIPAGTQVYVIGDSLSAGAGDRSIVTWPNLLAKSTRLSVRNLAEVGATAGIARNQVGRMSDPRAAVLLEVGGNDLLGSRMGGDAVIDFELQLNNLLRELKDMEASVFMFELPLHPMANEFGAVQRAAARRHGVPLIPKRVLAQVIASPGATTDTLHLSQTGHQLLADEVSRLIDITPAHPAEKSE